MASPPPAVVSHCRSGLSKHHSSSQGCAAEEDGAFPLQGQLISAVLQEDRSVEQPSSLQEHLMKYWNFLILVCEPQFCGREEHATEKSAKQNPQSLIPGEEGMELYFFI